MKIRKGDLVYTDGTQTIIIKRHYAYHYGPNGEAVGTSEVDGALFTRIKNAGFERKEPDLLDEEQRRLMDQIEDLPSRF